MKKLIALTLSALLLLTCALALAEAPAEDLTKEETLTVEEVDSKNIAEGTLETIKVMDKYKITAVIPDGYSMDIIELDLGVLIALTSDDISRPEINMTITQSEEPEYQGVTFKSSENPEQFEKLKALVAAETLNAEISTQTTAHGTELILVHEKTEVDEYLIIGCMWNGYLIEAHVFPGQGAEGLTEEQINTAIKFMSDFFIFEADAPAGNTAAAPAA